jgi:hypothetical protein
VTPSALPAYFWPARVVALALLFVARLRATIGVPQPDRGIDRPPRSRKQARHRPRQVSDRTPPPRPPLLEKKRRGLCDAMKPAAVSWRHRLTLPAPGRFEGQF